MNKIFWVSRHDLSAAQLQAIKELHGDDAVVTKDPVVFNGIVDLETYIREHSDGFVYVVAGAAHYIHAAFAGCTFGIFENHPQKRHDGTFGLSSVYHVGNNQIVKAWINPDPMGDEGEALIPILRK